MSKFLNMHLDFKAGQFILLNAIVWTLGFVAGVML